MVNKEVICIQNVSKKLGNNLVLDQVNLTVQAGEVVGIVGSNGSGKTTLLKMIIGLLYPDQGKVIVSGKAIQPGFLGDLPVSIGALIESPAFLPNFSGFTNLSMLASIREKIDDQRVKDVIRQVGLDPHSRKAVNAYSLGMRQRLGIAQAVMEFPEVLLFDEPTNGLDDQGVEIFAEILEESRQTGAAIILVSHVKEEISRFCDRIFQMKNGRLQSIEKEHKKSWRIVMESLEDLEKCSQLLPHLKMSHRVQGYPSGICEESFQSSQQLYEELTAKGIKVLDIVESQVS